MTYIANLETSEGDAMEVQFEYKFPWGLGGYKGMYMAGRTPAYYYGSNIGILVKLSDQRELPIRIISEITYFYVGLDFYENGEHSERQQYELLCIDGRSYLSKTNNEVIISTVKYSELRTFPRNQYIKFTLVYDKFTVPLIDPMNGSPDFQMNLYSAYIDQYSAQEGRDFRKYATYG